MKKRKSPPPVSGRELSPAMRLAERVARFVFGAVLPGVFLGAMISGALVKFQGGGLFAVPGVPVAVAALEAIFGAVLVGNWRERHGLRGILAPAALLLFLFSLFPGPRTALAVGGILLGGYLTALPHHGGKFRFLFGASFALSVCLLAGDAPASELLQVVLFTFLFAATVLWVRAHWLIRLAMIALLAVSAVLFADGMILGKPLFSQSEPRAVATALPAVLLADSEAADILFLSERPSLLPEVWAGMPFVATVESVRPRNERFSPGVWSKLRSHIGPPGKIVASLSGGYQLIYVDTLPGGSEAARRGFIEKLWNLLAPRNGVLVLPAVNRLLLPAAAQWAVLPGSGGMFVAASREAVATDLELLDRRLQKLLIPYDEENNIPAGIVPALYYTPTPPRLPDPENDLSPASPVAPPSFWITLGCLLAAYSVIRIYFRRFGRNAFGFALAENGAAFVLVLLAAFDAMSHRELFTGVPASMIWGCAGIALFAPRLRPRAGWLLIFAATLLPAVWFLPWSFVSTAPGLIAVTAVAALAAGVARGRLAEESEYPRSWTTTFSAVGWIAGGAIYATLTFLLRDPLLPALVTAAALRFTWPLEF